MAVPHACRREQVQDAYREMVHEDSSEAQGTCSDRFGPVSNPGRVGVCSVDMILLRSCWRFTIG